MVNYINDASIYNSRPTLALMNAKCKLQIANVQLSTEIEKKIVSAKSLHL